MITPHLRKSIGPSPWRRGFLLVPLVLACFALSPRGQAVVPAPDGGYPGGNTAEGDNALFSLAPGGGFNTAVGLNALFSDTTGSRNTANGVNALRFNIVGGSNTAIGTNALYSNTNSSNTAIGDSALFSNNTGNSNTAVGDGALEDNINGNSNTAVGILALDHNISGSFNTAIGRRALTNTTGGFNTALGYFAGSSLTTGNGNVYIGAQIPGVANENNHTYIKNIYSTFVGSARPVRVLATGLLGTLEASSRRFKDDINPMEKASEVILALKPVTFHYKKELDATGGTLQYGLVAEDVEKVMPELVYRDEQGKVDGVKYESINMMLLNEFLKEHRKVQQLEANAANQQKEIKALTASLKEQASQIQKVSAQLEASKPAPQVVNNP